MEKNLPCTIFDCIFDMYSEGIIVSDTVYGIDQDGNRLPAITENYMRMGNGVGQFFTGHCTDEELDEPEEQVQNDPVRWGYFDIATGKILVPPIYESADCFCSSSIACVELDSKYGFITPDGSVAMDIEWDQIRKGFHSGLCAVRKGDKWGYINKAGSVIIDIKFDDVSSFAESHIFSSKYILFNDSTVARVKKDKKWGYINENGLFVVDPIFDEIDLFNYIGQNDDDNYFAARVKKDGKYGFIDEKAAYIIQPLLEDAFEFWKIGYAAVKDHGKWGLIDRTGVFVVALQFEDVGENDETLSTGTGKSSDEFKFVYFTVKKDGQWGIMDADFNIIMPEPNSRYVTFKGSKIYIRNGEITSTRKIKEESKCLEL